MPEVMPPRTKGVYNVVLWDFRAKDNIPPGAGESRCA